ncbi:MAG: hypothetical protein NZM94_14220 [Roseiflexus sp.]|nr:hypothetical protein [Roseiflexus sp.]
MEQRDGKNDGSARASGRLIEHRVSGKQFERLLHRLVAQRSASVQTPCGQEALQTSGNDAIVTAATLFLRQQFAQANNLVFAVHRVFL